MNKFENYRKLKQQFDFVYHGIHLNRVLALSLWKLANGKLRFIWKEHFLSMVTYDVHRLQFDTNEQTILSIFGYYARKDHLEIYKAVLDRLDGKASYNEAKNLPRKLSIHPLTMLKVLRFVFSHMKELPFFDRYKLAVYCTHYCNTILELEKKDFTKVKKFLCMLNVLHLENLMTQYMKLRGIPTYSLVDGACFIFKKKIPLDVIQYENLETENLLCWGEFTVSEYASVDIPRERLRLAGYPKYVEISQLKSENSFKKCMILMARDQFRSTNQALLKILIEYSDEYDFCLKLHPACDYTFYSGFASKHGISVIPKEKTIDECLDMHHYDFAIAVNTTAYYESLMRGLPCLRFTDKTFDLMAGCDFDVFSTPTEFSSCMNTIQGMSLPVYQNKVDELLEYAMGVGVDNYKQILCE